MPKVIEEEKVFTATVKIFVARSYKSTTIKEIAEEAGVNEATLYRKYGSKANLIEQALDHRLSDTPLDKIAYTGDLNADLVAIVEAQLETHKVHGEILSILLAEVPRYAALKNTLARPMAHILGVATILQQYQMQGLLKDEFPMATVGVLLGPLIVREMFANALGRLPVPSPDAQKYVDDFLRGKGT